MRRHHLLPAACAFLAPLVLARAALADEPAPLAGPPLGPETPDWMPDVLRRVVLGNPLWRWALAFAVFVLAVVVARAVVRLATRRLGGMSAAVRAGIRDLPLEIFAKTRGIFYVLLGVWIASLFLALSFPVRRVVGVAVTIAVFLQVGSWTAHASRELLLHALRRRADEKGERLFTGLVSTLTSVAVWTLVLLLALENLGVDVGGLIAASAVATIGISMAAKDLFSDLFASLSIALDKPFEVGDFIVVGDEMGSVERIGLKSSRIRSLSGEQLVVSNADLLSSRIRNYKRMQDRRATFTIGVTYGTPADKLAAIPGWIREAVEAQEGARFDRSHFTAFADSALEFETVFFVEVPDYTRYCDVQQAVNLALYRRFEDEGVEFAFPTRTVHVAREEASDE